MSGRGQGSRHHESRSRGGHPRAPNRPRPSDQAGSSRSRLPRTGAPEPPAPKFTPFTSRSLSQAPKRPGYGESGRRTIVEANFYEIKNFVQENVLHYDIDISGLPDGVKKQLWSLVNEQHRSLFGEVNAVYDGVRNIYTAQRIPLGDEIEFTIVTDGDRSFPVKIKLVQEYTTESLARFLQGRGSFDSHGQMVITAFDVAFRMEPRMQFHMRPRSRSFFISNERSQGNASLGGGLEVYTGYYQSVRPAANKLFINIDVSATAFYETMRLDQLAAQILGFREPSQLQGRMTEDMVKKLRRSIRKMRVFTNHRGNKNRDFSIQDLGKPADIEAFEDEDGRRTTVSEYFHRAYGMRLRYKFLNCVIVNKARNIAVPMECCEVRAGTFYPYKLSNRQQSNMVKISAQPPEVRQQRIEHGRRTLKYDSNRFLNDFGLTVSPKMVRVDARFIPPPTIEYHHRSREPRITPEAGSWNLRGRRAVTGANINNWAVVSFANSQDTTRQHVMEFVQMLKRAATESGIRFNKPPLAMVAASKPATRFPDEIKKCLTQAAGQAAPSKLELILVILYDTDALVYGEIKKVCDVDVGVPSQCVQSSHVKRANAQYCANLCLKINCKLPNGVNSVIDLRNYPKTRNTFIFGADVTHPAPGSGSPSIAALCGSFDQSWARYRASVRVQGPRMEMVEDLKGMVMELMRTARTSPESIMFFRDGVSEGQFSEVLATEVPALRAACVALNPKINPKITFVIVQKRHHARFFPTADEDRDRSGNLLPGMIVESGVTHPFEFDFFLQSHAGLKGTCRPAHYHVLLDENDYTADELQTLTHHLCYTYSRCTRSVSIVPPAYYAHLIAARARFHVKGGYESDSASRHSETASSVSGSGELHNINEDVLKGMYFV